MSLAWSYLWNNLLRTHIILFIFGHVIAISVAFSANTKEHRAFKTAGKISLENRYFPDPGMYKNTKQYEGSLGINPEFKAFWDESKSVFSFTPYIFLSTPDNEKTHVDVRELSYTNTFGKFILKAGISTVYWGANGSRLLVDIVNQTDIVLNIEGGDKLGQPMLSLSHQWDIGRLDLFILPYFRERTFNGVEGRPRGQLFVDQNSALYEHEDEERHIDYAGRFLVQLGKLDLGISHFRGTDRTPQYVLAANQSSLRPFYVQGHQTGLDFKYSYESLLVKYEGIFNNAHTTNSYLAQTLGFEYTIYKFYNGVDINLFYEHIYDDRGESSAAIFNNHSVIGGRIYFNDKKSTEFLFAPSFYNRTGHLETIRARIGQMLTKHIKWELEVNTISSRKKTLLLYPLRKDDFFEARLRYFF